MTRAASWQPNIVTIQDSMADPRFKLLYGSIEVTREGRGGKPILITPQAGPGALFLQTEGVEWQRQKIVLDKKPLWLSAELG